MSNTIMPEVIGLDNLYCAKVVTDTLDAYTTGAASYFAPAGELKHDAKAASAVSYYDNSGMFVYPYEGEAEEELTVSGISERVAAEIFGKSYDSARGVIFDTGDPIYSPYYALGYRISVGGGFYKYRWFPKGLFVPSSETYKTKGDKVDPQGLTLTYKPVRTIHKWELPHPKDSTKTLLSGIKVTKTDTTDPAFTTEDSWFSQVQTPDTIGAPSALTLTAVPANNATGVLATAKPTLTFNNAIADYSGIILVGNNTIVNAPVSVDSTGKILTITPASNLTSAGVYTIVLAGVTDVFGQVLTTQSIKFTVA